MSRNKLKITQMHVVDDIIRHDLESLFEYKSFINSAVINERRQLEERMESVSDSMHDADIQEAVDDFIDDAITIERTFEKLSIYGFIILLYSYVDKDLERVCNAKYKDNHISKRLSDIDNSSGLNKYKKYIKNYTDLSVDFSGQSWKELITLQYIRQSIVHHNAKANDKLYRRTQQLKNKDFLKMDYKINKNNVTVYREMNIHQEYLDHILEYVYRFFEDLLE